MHIIVKLIVLGIFLGEMALSWLYLSGRRSQDIRSFKANQMGIVINGGLALAVVIWL